MAITKKTTYDDTTGYRIWVQRLGDSKLLGDTRSHEGGISDDYRTSQVQKRFPKSRYEAMNTSLPHSLMVMGTSQVMRRHPKSGMAIQVNPDQNMRLGGHKSY